MARKPYPEEHDDHERWLVSYADFMTLLFAFFVVMYAISSVEEKKLQQVSFAINNAMSFGSVTASEPNQIKLSEVAPQMALAEAMKRRRQLIAQREASQMQTMAETLTEKLSPLVSQGQVRVSQTARGVSIEISSSILFAPAAARLNNQTVITIQTIADVLKSYPNSIEVAGYTDNQPISNSEFPSNWELSAARASLVVRYLADFGINESRMRAIGDAANRPIRDNSTAEGRLRNRRVEIQILSN